MNKRKEMLEVLKKQDLTVTEISEKIGISNEYVRVYLGQFIKQKKVIISDPATGQYIRDRKYRAIDFEKLVGVLYDIMVTKMIRKKNVILTDEENKNIEIIERVLNIE